MTDGPRPPEARYDGYADWYDANIAPYAEAAGHDLLALLGRGRGRCLDLACGTGANLRRLTDAGWSVTGIDLSSDQLRRARGRVPEGVELVQGDAAALPFADGAFDAVACALLHTDVDDFTAVCREARRVLKPGGRLAYVGIHPCFVGPFARNPPGEPPELHPGYRNTAWTTEGFSDGIRRRAGAKHVPLADFLNAFLDAGFRLTRVVEAADEEYPTRIGLLAERPPNTEDDGGAVAMTSRGIHGVEYRWRGEFDNDELNALHAQAFGHAVGDDDWRGQVDRYSLGWVCARGGGELVGWVNVAWDGGVHAFILDTIVAHDARHCGIGTKLVEVAVEHRVAGCEWLHVDFDDVLAAFYFEACGFTPTPAGVIALR